MRRFRKESLPAIAEINGYSLVLDVPFGPIASSEFSYNTT